LLPEPVACPICGAKTVPAGEKEGRYVQQIFALRHCHACRFSFVETPVVDYEALYDEAYYAGRGADPLVDYLGEMSAPDRSIRTYEWRGILAVIQSLIPVSTSTRWLDFGAGNGGLVRHVRQQAGCEAFAYETGWITEHWEKWAIPSVCSDDLAKAHGTFDVVTAVEMLEHVPDPVSTLRQMRAALRPGGLLFLTTGNARPHRNRLAAWPYVIPELHVSFFEPDTLATALGRAGFQPTFPGFREGWADIVRFKLLKNLRRQRRSRLEALVPWSLVARAVNRRYGLSSHPIGWASRDEPGLPLSSHGAR
jgi:SAM-dependent methyltransferase